MARVSTPTPTALGFALTNASGSARIAPIGPPGAGARPRNGRLWIMMMMMPIPDMNPEITTAGV